MSLIESSFKRAFQTMLAQKLVTLFVFVTYGVLTYIQYIQPELEESSEVDALFFVGLLGIVFASLLAFLLTQLAVKQYQQFGVQLKDSLNRFPNLIWKGIQFLGVFLLIIGITVIPIILSMEVSNPILTGIAILVAFAGIVALCFFSIVGGFMPYIFVEFPQLNLMQAFQKSKKMVKEHFVQLMLLSLILIGAVMVLGFFSSIMSIMSGLPEGGTEVSLDSSVGMNLPVGVLLTLSALSGILSTVQGFVVSAIFYIILEKEVQN